MAQDLLNSLTKVQQLLAETAPLSVWIEALFCCVGGYLADAYVILLCQKTRVILMDIRSLHLQNFGRFQDLTVQFAPTEEVQGKVTVFIGNNGAGKTSILKA